MNYCFSKVLPGIRFDKANEKMKSELKKEGFGILTEIDVKKTLKNKIGVDFKKYRIFGACNPHFAYKALQCEDKIGILLPCNVIVEEHDNGDVEVSIIDPVVSMSSIENPNLEVYASEVKQKLLKVIGCL